MTLREMREKGINITKCKKDLVLPSSPAPRNAICLLDKKVLSHTINNKHQEGEKMKNYFSNVSGRVIKFNCLESGCFCKLPQSRLLIWILNNVNITKIKFLLWRKFKLRVFFSTSPSHPPFILASES